MKRWRSLWLAGFVFALHVALIAAGVLIGNPRAATYLQLTHTPFDVLLQWDAQWYAAIARYGYDLPLRAQQAFHITGNPVPFAHLRATAFFPLLPLVIHVVGTIGAVIVLNLAFFGTLVLMYVLFRPYLSERKTLLAMVLYGLNPAMVYESALYTESFAVLFSMLVVYGIRRGGKIGDAVACAAGFAATLNHELGILLAVFALRYVRVRRIGMALTYGLSVVAGWAVFIAYLGVRYGHPLAMFTAEESWHRTWAFPGWNWVEASLHGRTLDVLMVPLLAVPIALHIQRSLRQDRTLTRPTQALSPESVEVALWLAGLLLLGLCTYIPRDALVSVTRFLTVAWPLYGWFFVQDEARSRRWLLAFLFLFALFAIMGTAEYTHGYFFE